MSFSVLFVTGMDRIQLASMPPESFDQIQILCLRLAIYNEESQRFKLLVAWFILAPPAVLDWAPSLVALYKPPLKCKWMFQNSGVTLL